MNTTSEKQKFTKIKTTIMITTIMINKRTKQPIKSLLGRKLEGLQTRESSRALPDQIPGGTEGPTRRERKPIPQIPNIVINNIPPNPISQAKQEREDVGCENVGLLSDKIFVQESISSLYYYKERLNELLKSTLTGTIALKIITLAAAYFMPQLAVVQSVNCTVSSVSIIKAMLCAYAVKTATCIIPSHVCYLEKDGTSDDPILKRHKSNRHTDQVVVVNYDYRYQQYLKFQTTYFWNFLKCMYIYISHTEFNRRFLRFDLIGIKEFVEDLPDTLPRTFFFLTTGAIEPSVSINADSVLTPCPEFLQDEDMLKFTEVVTKEGVKVRTQRVEKVNADFVHRILNTSNMNPLNGLENTISRLSNSINSNTDVSLTRNELHRSSIIGSSNYVLYALRKLHESNPTQDFKSGLQSKMSNTDTGYLTWDGLGDHLYRMSRNVTLLYAILLLSATASLAYSQYNETSVSPLKDFLSHTLIWLTQLAQSWARSRDRIS